MEKTFVYTPVGVCSVEMRIIYDPETMVVKEFIPVRGCQGNTQGVAKLIQGMGVEEAMKRLSGIKCRGSRGGMTSCPDQLSIALREILVQEGKIA